MGFLSGNEKYAAYYDSDVFVYPSQYEIFGMSPFEALQFDTPSYRKRWMWVWRVSKSRKLWKSSTNTMI